MKLNRFPAIATVFLVVLASCSEDKPASAPATAGTAAAGVGTPSAAGTSSAGTSGTGTSGTGSAGTGTAGTNTVGAAGTSAVGTAGTSSAGAAGTGSGTAIAPTFDTVKLVFGGGGGIMTCSAAPCHGVNGMAPPNRPLELPPNDDAKLYANLTTYVSAACNNTKLVTPGNPAQSALVTILKGPCGATPRMPFGCSAEAGDCIPDEYIAAVTQWIANGAPQK